MLLLPSKITKLFVFVSFFLLTIISSITIKAAPGDLDAAFGSGGKVVTAGSRFSADVGYAAVTQPDGKIVVAGQANGAVSGFAVARFNPDGSFDGSFGNGGRVRKEIYDNFGITHYASAVALQPDGKILVGGFSPLINSGSSRRTFTLIRFNSDGSFDGTFGTGGYAQADFPDNLHSFINDIAIQPDGKIVAVGYASTSGNVPPTTTTSMAAARFNSNGSIDTSFGTGGYWRALSGQAKSVLIQPDSKIVIAGGSVDFILFRLNPDGLTDNSFDGNGWAETPIGTSTDVGYAVALQPDGKLVMTGSSLTVGVGEDTAVVRYNPDGSLDTGFDGDGKVVTSVSNTNDGARGVEILPSGKIIVAGSSGSGNAADFSAVRYNADGSLDTSFDGDGIAGTAASALQDQALTVIISQSGKLLAVGNSVSSNSDFALVQYNDDGSLDAAFGTNGIAVRELGLGTDAAYDVVIQPDGKIVAAGESYNGLGTDFTVIRYNPNGTLDSSFGINGVVITTFGTIPAGAPKNAVLNSIIIQPDGKLLAAGSVNNRAPTNNDFALVRYNTDGSLDSSFGTNGIVMTSVSDAGSFADAARALALQSDGKIIAVGDAFSTSIGRNGFAVVRYNENGSLDTSFDGDGKAATSLGSDDTAFDVVIQTDGKIAVAGRSFNDTNNINNFALARYNPNGSLDTSFSDDGKTITSIDNLTCAAQSLVIQPDGKLVAAGYATVNDSTQSVGFGLIRYNSDGSPDLSFGAGGIVTTVFRDTVHTDEIANDLILQPDGKLIAAGYSLKLNSNPLDVTDYDFAIARYNRNGSLDSGFGTAGKALTAITNGSDKINALALQQDGKIVAAGYSGGTGDYNFALVRYQGIATTTAHTPFDYDGDGKADLSVFRPSSGSWYISNSSNNAFVATQFGTSGDLIAPADFDGDGKTDINVFRPSDGTWYRLNSATDTFSPNQFGTSGDLPVPGDFDGDGKADLTVYRPSVGSWFRVNSSNSQFVAVQFGVAEDKPLVGDFDGDGKSDLTVFRPSNGTWYRINSASDTFSPNQFGATGDLPVAADYDGDGKTDLAVYRPSVGDWYIVGSSNSAFISTHFGITEDKPAPADFDGDGKADLVVFRPSSGTWYLLRTAAGFTGFQFGASGDIPTPNAFVR